MVLSLTACGDDKKNTTSPTSQPPATPVPTTPAPTEPQGTDGLMYTEVPGGTYAVAGYIGTDTDVVIPSTYK